MKAFKQYYLLLFGLLVFISACKNSSTSSDENPPEIPELLGVTPDISYFDNGPDFSNATQENSNFTNANLQATVSSSLLSISQAYTGFFNAAGSENADLNNGVWNWSYTYNYQGISAQVRLTSEERNGRIFWEMNWTYNDGQNSYEDYTVIEGSVATDGSDGEWTINDLESGSEIPIFLASWEILSETNQNSTIEIRDDGQVVFTIEYSMNGPDHLMTINSEDEPEIIIGWNTETGTGFYQEGAITNRVCWDSNYVNTSC